MRNMSFSMTKDQFRARTKRVTRRLGWWDLKVGDRVMGVEKGMGLKKGEKVVQLGPIVIVSVTREALSQIIDYWGRDDCKLEGFPDMSPREFVKMFCAANGCKADTEINRIEFDYVDVHGAIRADKTILTPAAAWPFPEVKP